MVYIGEFECPCGAEFNSDKVNVFRAYVAEHRKHCKASVVHKELTYTLPPLPTARVMLLFKDM